MDVTVSARIAQLRQLQALGVIEYSESSKSGSFSVKLGPAPKSVVPTPTSEEDDKETAEPLPKDAMALALHLGPR